MIDDKTTIKLGLILLFAAALALMPEMVLAADSGGQGLPWEGPLQKVRDSITGPVAYSISLLGLVAAGAALVFGGEINEFVRRIIMLVLVISLIVFAGNILQDLFSKSAVL